jgi:hypothetical protein
VGATPSNFDYVAWATSTPQSIEPGRSVSGSLLRTPRRAAHVKAVNRAEMDAMGACTVRRIALAPRRDVPHRGTLKDLIAARRDAGRDYLLVTCSTRAAPQAGAQLTDVYPSVLELRRVDSGLAGATALPRAAITAGGPNRELQAFFSQVTGEARRIRDPGLPRDRGGHAPRSGRRRERPTPRPREAARPRERPPHEPIRLG